MSNNDKTANGGKTALVTGATSGIGHEIAKILAKDGYNLVIVSRSKEDLDEIAAQLQKLSGAKVTAITKDLFEPSAAEELYNEVKAQGIAVNILVNDAGQGVYGKFAETDLQEELDIIQLNIVALVTLTKLFLKDM